MLHAAGRKNDVQRAGGNLLAADQRQPRADPIYNAFVGHWMSMRCRFGTGRHAAVMKTAAADSVSWPEQQYHRNINSAEERAAIHVEERAVAPDFFHRKIPSAHCGITVVVMEFVVWRKIAKRRFFPCFFDRVELHLAATSIVIARRLV